MQTNKYYVLTITELLDIDKKISVQVFTDQKDALDAFKGIEIESAKYSDNPGTYFLDESIFGKYAGLIHSFHNDAVMLILQETDIKWSRENLLLFCVDILVEIDYNINRKYERKQIKCLTTSLKKLE